MKHSDVKTLYLAFYVRSLINDLIEIESVAIMCYYVVIDFIYADIELSIVV